MPDIIFPHLGITIDQLNRVAFTVPIFGGLQVYWYGIFITCGVIAGLFLALREAKRTGQDPDIYTDFLLYALIAAVIGARAYYVIFSWDFYSANPDKILAIRDGGLAIYGGVLAAIATALVYTKKKRLSFALLADTAIPSLALGQAIGRWGNFFNREAFGGFTDSLFAMQLRLSQVRSGDLTEQILANTVLENGVEYIQVHPTFFYESCWNFILCFLLVWMQRRRKFDGQIFALYLVGYGIGRFWIEGLRTDQLLIGNFAVSQLLSAVLILAGIGMLLWGRKKGTLTACHHAK